MNFSYTANDASTAREATVTVKYDGKEYGTVTVAQKGMPEVAGDPLITKALYMTGYCAGYGYNGWTNKEVMKFGKTISVEMLVKHEGEFDDSIGSLFGTERRLLIRLKQKLSLQLNCLQINGYISPLSLTKQAILSYCIRTARKSVETK